jgi:hypothetical protein
MRTSIDIDDALLREVKLLAKGSGKTVKSVVEDALRERLARRKSSEPAKSVTIHTVGGHGLLPGVNLDDSAALRDLMDGLS